MLFYKESSAHIVQFFGQKCHAIKMFDILYDGRFTCYYVRYLVCNNAIAQFFLEPQKPPSRTFYINQVLLWWKYFTFNVRYSPNTRFQRIFECIRNPHRCNTKISTFATLALY